MFPCIIDHFLEFLDLCLLFINFKAFLGILKLLNNTVKNSVNDLKAEAALHVDLKTPSFLFTD